MFYVLFALARFFFAKPLFAVFFVTSRDILQKVRVCYKQLQHLLFSSRPHFMRQPTGIQGSASTAKSIPYLEGSLARAKNWVGLAVVSA
jgi:hypothetical protein